MSLNLSKNILAFLERQPDEAFTARQIAQWIVQEFSAECDEKLERSVFLNNHEELLRQLVAEIGSRFPSLANRNPQLRATQGRPRKYYYTEQSAAEEIAATAQNKPDKSALNEHTLYPLLCDYLRSQHNLYPLRIDEKKSSNSRGAGGNRWLYPDLVALENLAQEWHREVKTCVVQSGGCHTRLWSFEVKLKLNRSNVRESYFQAVSNSSWANYGYLVAAHISGDDTLKELRMLFGLHGIGLIHLNQDNPPESEILIPARERNDVDWNTCSRLAHENKDFHRYIQLIRQFYQTGDVRQQDWDS